MNWSSTSRQDSAPELDFAAHDFFYINLRVQEVLTTIRYGIEARKGWIVLTGDAGSGKTKLLQTATGKVAENVICICESDPRISFADLLKVMLRTLDCEIADHDEAAMVRACRIELRSRLERCQIVSLLLDNAHLLPDPTLRHLTQNFLGGSAEDPDGALLQLVLAGRPELRTKLSQTALIPLRRRRPIVCELQPLSSRDVASYIEQALSSNKRPPALFDERAFKRVALYTRGNLRAVNTLCERALLLAGAAGVITPELIEGAARDLDLHPSEVGSDVSQQREFAKPGIDDRSRAFEFTPVDDPNPTFPPRYDAEVSPNTSQPLRKRRSPASVALLTILLALGGAAADRAISFFRDWRATFKQIAAPVSPQPSERIAARTEELAKVDAPIPVPGPDYPAVPQQDQATSLPVPPALSKPNDGAPPLASDEAYSPQNPGKLAPPSGASKTTQGRSVPPTDNSPGNRNLQSQIAKAIESRAIIGVEVSVVQGTAYLDGHVASERQRRAAERAARSVAGVERVQNRITLG